MTSILSFHWFTPRDSLNLEFMSSSIHFDNRPISFFAGLINLTDGLFAKFSLWSLSVMKQFPVPFISILSRIPAFFAIPTPSLSIISLIPSGAFL